MYCLTQFQQYQQSLRSGNLAIASFVQEVIRWQSPLHFTIRFALQDMLIENVEIPKGSVLQVCIGSANRDECVFEDADNFNPFRDVKNNLAFGGGAHNCPGINLAKAELEVTLKKILEETSWINSLEKSFVPYTGLSFRRPERFDINVEWK